MVMFDDIAVSTAVVYCRFNSGWCSFFNVMFHSVWYIILLRFLKFKIMST